MVPGMLGAPLIDTVYWTLEFELRFYFLIFLVLVFRQIHRAQYFCFAWLALYALSLIIDLPWLVGFLILKPYSPFFIGGCFFYLLSLQNGNFGIRAGLIASLSFCCIEALRERAGFIAVDGASGIVVPLGIVAMFAAFWLSASSHPGKVSQRVMMKLGALTYPLYLTHGMIGSQLVLLLTPVLGAGMSLGLATITALLLAQMLVAIVDIPARKPFATLLRKLVPARLLSM
jgi:peptidoglycan/LPS O-acetylase OafA/YrhL